MGEGLRDGGNLQPPNSCGDTFLSALMPRRVGRLLAAAEADFPLSKQSPYFCSSPWSVLPAPKWLLMPSAKNVLYKPGRLGTHCLV